MQGLRLWQNRLSVGIYGARQYGLLELCCHSVYILYERWHIPQAILNVWVKGETGFDRCVGQGGNHWEQRVYTKQNTLREKKLSS